MSKLYEKLAASKADKAFDAAARKEKWEAHKDERDGTIAGGLGGAAIGSLPGALILAARHKAKKNGNKVGKLNNRVKAILIGMPIAGAGAGAIYGHSMGELSRQTKEHENDIARVFHKELPHPVKDAAYFRNEWNKKHGEKEGYIPSEIKTKDGKKIAFESRLFMEKVAQTKTTATLMTLRHGKSPNTALRTIELARGKDLSAEEQRAVESFLDNRKKKQVFSQFKSKQSSPSSATTGRDRKELNLSHKAKRVIRQLNPDAVQAEAKQFMRNDKR